MNGGTVVPAVETVPLTWKTFQWVISSFVGVLTLCAMAWATSVNVHLGDMAEKHARQAERVSVLEQQNRELNARLDRDFARLDRKLDQVLARN